MRTRNTIAGLIVSLALSGATLLAANSPRPRSIEDRVRHEILSVPYFNVFENVAFSVKDGVVTLTGEVTRPIDKDYIEQAVRRAEGVTAIEDRIEVLPVSPLDDRIRLATLDDRIRLATLRTLERTSPLSRYFLGVNPSIRIIVKNGNVALDGVVLNSFDRQVAYMAANRVPGVFSVTNNLRTEK
jgi:hyperosmotically inducible protein